MRAAIAAADAGCLLHRALLSGLAAACWSGAHAVDVIAAGKPSRSMLRTFVDASPAPLRHMLGVGPGERGELQGEVEWFAGGHPLPDQASLAAARRALHLATTAHPDDTTVVLLSGGASALMALPIEGVTLDDKRATTKMLLAGGASIAELNVVRKHLSAVKGGRLAAACPGRTVTFAISDIAGDDLSLIGSGPTVADPSTWAMCQEVLGSLDADRVPPRVTQAVRRGVDGALVETPKPGDSRLARSSAFVIGSARDAIDGARAAAEDRGYRVQVVEGHIHGEARQAARDHAERVGRMSALGGPVCLLSAGETTVRVQGHGRGGRNQEFALALAEDFDRASGTVVAASVGTDGIDGPTDAAGAIVDSTTQARALALGLDPRAFLGQNNTYEFFRRLDDLIITGPTSTNVGDLQVVLMTS